MCGRYGTIAPKDDVEVWQRYELSNKPEIKTTYNIAPTMQGLVVHKNSPNLGEYLPFGIEASWKPGMRLINAKSETVAELRTFAKMFRETRCLIPASFFFEWQKTEKGKQPLCFKVKGEDLFSFAGIYRPEEGFVILTTKPNSIMEPIHNRMPCILTEKDEDIWLDPKSSVNKLMELLDPFPSNHMEAFHVSELVNSPRNQGPEVIKHTD